MTEDVVPTERGVHMGGGESGLGEPPAGAGGEWEYELDFCLDEFLANNFEKVFGGRLRLYVDDEGQVGWRYPTPIGQIDMLAVEVDTGSFVVIKVKPGWATEEDLGRLLAEMKWVGENMRGGTSDVKGWIIDRKSVV